MAIGVGDDVGGNDSGGQARGARDGQGQHGGQQEDKAGLAGVGGWTRPAAGVKEGRRINDGRERIGEEIISEILVIKS